MKKLALSALALAAMPVMAGTPVVVTAPAPEACPWSVDAAMTLRDQLNDTYDMKDKSIDTIGADLTINYALTEADFVNVRFGYSWGDTKYSIVNNCHYSMEFDQHTFYVMPGYKHVWAVNNSLSIFAGVNAGVANVSQKFEQSMDGSEWRSHDSDWGFAYSAEAGVSYEFCPNWSVFGAVEFFGTQAEAFKNTNNKPYYAGLRLGVSTKF